MQAQAQALAVFILMTNSNLVGCSTGSSPGLAPRKRRTRSRKRQESALSGSPCLKSAASGFAPKPSSRPDAAISDSCPGVALSALEPIRYEHARAANPTLAPRAGAFRSRGRSSGRRNARSIGVEAPWTRRGDGSSATLPELGQRANGMEVVTGGRSARSD